MVLAAVVGVLAAWVWQVVRRSRFRWAAWLRRQVTDSAWDQALDDAHHAGRGIWVLMDDGIKYRGGLLYGGREDAQASGWVYLTDPERVDTETKKYVPLPSSHGLLLDRDRAKLVGVYMTPEEKVAKGGASDVT
jgi:hypothetical protein